MLPNSNGTGGSETVSRKPDQNSSGHTAVADALGSDFRDHDLY
jgi:hypothetical protein